MSVSFFQSCEMCGIFGWLFLLHLCPFAYYCCRLFSHASFLQFFDTLNITGMKGQDYLRPLAPSSTLPREFKKAGCSEPSISADDSQDLFPNTNVHWTSPLIHQEKPEHTGSKLRRMPETKPCIEVSLTISSQYFLNSHTNSGSFPTGEVSISCPSC